MKLHFYENQIIKIKSLIAKGKYQEALTILNSEMQMPYIPLAYEKKFNELVQKLHNNFQNQDDAKQITLERIVEMLWLNEEKQMIALNAIGNYYLKPIKKELKRRIESWKDIYKQSLLYEMLVEQKIDVEIKINNKFFNPLKFSIFENKKVQEAIEEIRKLAFKSPQIEKLAISEFYKYLLLTFGQLNFEGGKTGAMVFNIVNQMFFKSRNLTQEEQKIKQMLGHQK